MRRRGCDAAAAGGCAFARCDGADSTTEAAPPRATRPLLLPEAAGVSAAAAAPPAGEFAFGPVLSGAASTASDPDERSIGGARCTACDPASMSSASSSCVSDGAGAEGPSVAAAAAGAAEAAGAVDIRAPIAPALRGEADCCRHAVDHASRDSFAARGGMPLPAQTQYSQAGSRDRWTPFDSSKSWHACFSRESHEALASAMRVSHSRHPVRAIWAFRGTAIIRRNDASTHSTLSVATAPAQPLWAPRDAREIRPTTRSEPP